MNNFRPNSEKYKIVSRLKRCRQYICVFLLAFVAFDNPVIAQTITTFAGGGSSGDGGPATAASVIQPWRVFIDAAGNKYIVEFGQGRVRKVNPSGTISTVAGGGFGGDGSPATAASLSNPTGFAIDAAGNMYIAEFTGNRIRKVNTSGIISTIGGGGSASTDGVAATTTNVNSPMGLAVDAAGNVYYTEWYTGHRVRKISTSGIVTTVAGVYTNSSYNGDGIAATAANLNTPFGLCFDAAGNLYVTEFGGNRVRKVNTSGIISTVAGNGGVFLTGDGGPATAATLWNPAGVSFDAGGNMYIGDMSNNCIRKVNTSGTISRVAGNGTASYSGDGGPATNATLASSIDGVIDPSTGNLFIADRDNNRVRMVTNVGTICSTPPAISGSSSVCVDNTTTFGNATGGGTWSSSNTSVGTISSSGVFTGISAGTSVVSYTVTGGCAVGKVVTTNALPSASLSSSAACTGFPIVMSSSQNYSNVVWKRNGSVFKVTTPPGSPTIATIGAGQLVNNPGVFLSAAGDLYVADQSKVYKFPKGFNSSTTGIVVVTTNHGRSVYVDASNNVYAIESGAVRRYAPGAPSSGTIIAQAGMPIFPSGFTMDLSGNLFVSDYFSNRIVEYPAGSTSTTTPTVVATFSGHSGYQLYVDEDGTIYMPLITGNTVLKFNWLGSFGSYSAGTVVAGTGTSGFGPTQLNQPTGVCVDIAKNIYVFDVGTGRVKKFPSNSVSGISSTTVAGGGGTLGSLSNPWSGVMDAKGILYISDYSNNRIQVYYPPVSAGTTDTLAADSSGSYTAVVTSGAGCSATTSAYAISTSPSAITGPSSLCVAATITLSNTTSGGTWSSSNEAVGTVNSSGVVTGISAGTMSITYSIGGCSTVKAISVNATPSAISGPSSVCQGASVSLSNTLSGGSWISDNTSIADITSGGLLTGIAGGVTTITYMVGSCFVTTNVTVNPYPDAGEISGPITVAGGSTISLSATVSGGTWSTSNGNATVSSSGIVAGIALGPVSISYHVTNDCGTTSTLHNITVVSPIEGEIGGPLSVCIGATTTLSASPSGGIWSSDNTAVATVGSGTGVVTSVSVGTATISYTLSGFSVTAVVSVNALPSVITGASSICASSTSILSSATSGGTWSSSNPSVADIDPSTGIVTGISAGAATFAYTLSSGCFRTKSMTVNPLPTAIMGSLSVCPGSTTTLSSTTGGGVSWISSNTTVATVGITSGVLTGLSAGTAAITYTISTGCMVKAIVTVNDATAPITGTMFVCAGSTTALSSSASGGTWSSSTIAVATVGTDGTVTGVANGTASITYTLPTGCRTTATVTVGLMPAAITGTLAMCIGGTISLASATVGGTWSSTNPSAATVGSSTGIVSGAGTGTSTISYTYTSGCARTAVITVSAGPGANTGTATLCVATTTTLGNATTGGTWSSSATANATVNASTGVVTGVSAGTPNITYTVSAGCYTITQVTVSAPISTSITGSTNICAGATTTFTHPIPGGIWTSSNTSKATVGSSTGIITGVSAGTPTITYTVGSCYKTKSITVSGGNAAITGTMNICMGSTSVLSCTTPGGTVWSSTNTGVATIGSTSGVVTGVAVGTSDITYAASTGCTSTAVVTVIALPTVISGTLTVCQAATTSLASTGTTGGTWVSSAPSKATVGSSTGTVTGVAMGTSMITYTWTNTCKRTAVISVNPLPATAAIVGAGTMSPTTASTQTLTASQPGGTWTSANTARATIVAGTGFMTAISAGTVVISYSQTNSCGTLTNTRIFTIISPRPGVQLEAADDNTVITVYPNPTPGMVTIEAPVTGVFTVYTIDGREVCSRTIKDITTTLSLPNNLAVGVYMCRFNGDDGSTTVVRLVVEH